MFKTAMLVFLKGKIKPFVLLPPLPHLPTQGQYKPYKLLFFTLQGFIFTLSGKSGKGAVARRDLLTLQEKGRKDFNWVTVRLG